MAVVDVANDADDFADNVDDVLGFIYFWRAGLTCLFRLFLLALFVEAKTMGLGAMRVSNWRLVLLVFRPLAQGFRSTGWA